MEFETKIASFVLRGYSEWTERLGADREWIIQSKQGELQSIISVEAASVGALYIPLRHDVILLAASGVPDYSLKRVAATLQRVSPVPVETHVGCGGSPVDALKGGECRRDAVEATLVAHVDLEGSHRMGPLEAFYKTLDMYYTLSRELRTYGAIVAYLGGDNILALLPFNEDTLYILEDVAQDFAARVGVGFSTISSRRAAALATECLDKLRRGRSERLTVCGEGRPPDWLIRFRVG